MSRAGFTLLEVLMVIVLIGLLAAFVVPEMTGTIGRAGMDESVERLRALTAMTRASAMENARRYRIVFRQDGSIRCERQVDPLTAPDAFVRVRSTWSAHPVLLEHVWVDELLPLPQGPPPLDIEDDEIEFFDLEEELLPIGDFPDGHALYFEPDGIADSARWILRDRDGRGTEITYDGRIGRLTAVTLERVRADAVQRPEPLEEDLEALRQQEDELLELESRGFVRTPP